jgi:hypothetical protein
MNADLIRGIRGIREYPWFSCPNLLWFDLVLRGDFVQEKKPRLRDLPPAEQERVLREIEELGRRAMEERKQRLARENTKQPKINENA